MPIAVMVCDNNPVFVGLGWARRSASFLPGHTCAPRRRSTRQKGATNEALGCGGGLNASYNVAVESAYIDQVMQGHLPVACTSPGHAYEKGLVFFPKRMSYDTEDLVDLDLMETYGAKLNSLTDVGVIEQDGTIIRLTEEGKRTYSELMVGFFSEQQRRLYRRVCGRLQSEIGVVSDHEWTSNEVRIRSLGALNAMTKDAARRPTPAPA